MGKITYEKDLAFLTCMVVGEKHRRRGFGTLILKHLIRMGEVKGYKSIFAKVRNGNMPTETFLKNNGFILSSDSRYYNVNDGTVKIFERQLF